MSPPAGRCLRNAHYKNVMTRPPYMNLSLKLRAWQLFVILVGLPFCFSALLVSPLISSNQVNAEVLFTVVPLFVLVYGGIIFLWFWALGVGLNELIPEKIRPRAKFFKFGVMYSAAYMVLFQTVFLLSVNGHKIDDLLPIVALMHLFAMYCMFYSIHFISKNLVTHEQQREVEFESYSVVFFLLWLFPIGVWFIQPRLNKLYESTKS